MRRIICFVFLFTAANLIYAQDFLPSFEFPISVQDNNNLQLLILGYHKFATDGLDPDLGEVFIPQIPAGQFGARFKLPVDTNITTTKDLRFSCGHIWSYTYRINISYQSGFNTASLNWNNAWEIYGLKFINPFNGVVLGYFEGPNLAGTLYLPMNLTDVDVEVYFNIPLSWPSYILISPNGGEVLQAGEIATVNYQMYLPYPPGYGFIEYSTDYGLTWIVSDSVSQLATSYNWLVPNISSNHVKLRIGDFPCVFDTSDGTFIIYQNTPPTLYSVELPMTINNSLGDTVHLLAGMHPDAANGLDPFLGETNQSPPAAGEFGSFLRLGDNALSFIDYRPGYHLYMGNKNYQLRVYPRTDSVTTLRMVLPQGAFLKITYIQNVPGWAGMYDTTFTAQQINFTFPPGTRYHSNINLIFTFDGTIPVELVSFTADVINNSVRLSWTTASELNNKGFEIERKKNLQSSMNNYSINNWQTIAFVEGQGTTSETTYYAFLDEQLSMGRYYYRLKQIDYDGTLTYSDEIEIIIGQPDNYYLSQNYPNPFNPRTTIEYSLPVRSKVTLAIYNVVGEQVIKLIDEEQDAGSYSIPFDASLPSGVYFYRISAGDYVNTKKMMLVK